MLTFNIALSKPHLALAAADYHSIDHHDHELAIFIIAGLLLITTGSTLCSQSPRSIVARNRGLLQCVWAVSAVTLALGQQALHSLVSDNSELPPPILLLLGGLEMLTWLRTILAYLRTVPATIIAKRTIFWKLFHLSRGTFQESLRSLHRTRGDEVQIAPRQYSVSNPSYFQRLAQLEQIGPLRTASDLIEPKKITELLAEAFAMANIFSYERDVERCNTTLANSLYHYAATGDVLKLSDLLTCYVFDVLFATTTGQAAGFMDRPADITKLLAAMKRWKFYAVLYGTYLRFHPFINKVAKMAIGSDEALTLVLDRLPDVKDATGGTTAYVRQLVDTVDEENIRQLLTASAALITSASDPLITHLMTTIYHVYQSPEVLQALRDEIIGARIYQPPRLRYILKSRERLPLLHAVLKETLRLHPISTPEYNSPDGGVMIGEKLVPANCTICLQPSIAHQDSSIFGPDPHLFNPARWLQDASVVGPMKSHLLAFGAGTHNTQHEDLHYALIVKLLIQLLPTIDLEMATTMLPTNIMPTIGLIREHLEIKVKLPNASGMKLPASPLRATASSFAPETTSAPELPPTLSFRNAARYISSRTLGEIFSPTKITDLAAAVTSDDQSPTLSAASTANSDLSITAEDKANLARLIGDNATRRLLESFDPSQPLTSRPPVRTWVMKNDRARAQAHELIDRLWDGRLRHSTDRKTNRIWIDLKQERVSTEVSLQGLRLQHPTDKSTPAAPRTEPVICPAWGAFLKDENDMRAAKKAEGDALMADPERHAAHRKKFADVLADKKVANEEGPSIKFKTTFKQTSGKTTNDQLGGPRVHINQSNENKASDETASTSDSTDASVTEDAAGVVLTAAKPKSAVILPHMRKHAIAVAKTAEPEQLSTTPIPQERTPSPPVEAASNPLYASPQIRGRSEVKRAATPTDSPITSPAHSPSKAVENSRTATFKQRGSLSPATSPSKRSPRSVTPPHLRKRSMSPSQVVDPTEWVAARLPMPFA